MGLIRSDLKTPKIKLRCENQSKFKCFGCSFFYSQAKNWSLANKINPFHPFSPWYSLDFVWFITRLRSFLVPDHLDKRSGRLVPNLIDFDSCLLFLRFSWVGLLLYKSVSADGGYFIVIERETMLFNNQKACLLPLPSICAVSFDRSPWLSEFHLPSVVRPLKFKSMLDCCFPIFVNIGLFSFLCFHRKRKAIEVRSKQWQRHRKCCWFVWVVWDWIFVVGWYFLIIWTEQWSLFWSKQLLLLDPALFFLFHSMVDDATINKSSNPYPFKIPFWDSSDSSSSGSIRETGVELCSISSASYPLPDCDEESESDCDDEAADSDFDEEATYSDCNGDRRGIRSLSSCSWTRRYDRFCCGWLVD